MQTAYSVRRLDLPGRIRLCERAKGLSDRWWVDVLDCKKSGARQRAEMSWDEIMAKLTMKCHYVALHRQFMDPPYFEVGWSTMEGDPDWFLWIVVSESKMDILIEEFGLTKFY